METNPPVPGSKSPAQPPSAQNLRSAATLLAWNMLIPLVFVAAVLLFFHARGTFEFSYDEGVELAKADLVERGYSLYSEIWNDQPPLMTYVLAGTIRYLGREVGINRFIVLLFAAALLWAAFKFLEIVFGKWQALLGAISIFLLPKFMVLSVSVMVGLPAITLAMLGLLVLAVWHRKPSPLLIIASAALLSLSVFTKVFTLFLAPVFLGGVFLGSYLPERGRIFRREVLGPVFLWGGVFGALCALLFFGLVGFEHANQLLGIHVSAPENPAFANDRYTLFYYLNQSVPLLLLGLLGAIFTFQQKKWVGLYLVAWAGLGILVFSTHRPVWDHHMVVITIPVAMLAGVAAYEALAKLGTILRENWQPKWQTALILAAVLGLFFFAFQFRVPEPIALMESRPSLTNSGLEIGPLRIRFLEEMRNYQEQTNWVVTDLPMFAYRVGLPVPPETAVFSAKRVETVTSPTMTCWKCCKHTTRSRFCWAGSPSPRWRPILNSFTG
jgi:hypothetical protein